MNEPRSFAWRHRLALVSLLLAPSLAFAWIGVGTRGASLTTSNSEGHGKITIDAYNWSTTFRNYMNDNGLQSTLLKYVAEADVDEEKTYVAHLDNNYTGVVIWEKSGNVDSMAHCAATLHTVLAEDPRLHNGIECVKLALRLKASEPTTAMRIFANGLHLLQDYFAHLNAPGGDGTEPHGIPAVVKIDTNGNGVVDTSVGTLCDELLWDNHNDSGGTIPWSERVTNLYNITYWHKHSTFAGNWRRNAAYDITIEAMQCYAVYGNTNTLETALTRGYVVNGDRTTYIDLLTRN